MGVWVIFFVRLWERLLGFAGDLGFVASAARVEHWGLMQRRST